MIYGLTRNVSIVAIMQLVWIAYITTVSYVAISFVFLATKYLPVCYPHSRMHALMNTEVCVKQNIILLFVR